MELGEAAIGLMIGQFAGDPIERGEALEQGQEMDSIILGGGEGIGLAAFSQVIRGEELVDGVIRDDQRNGL